jgi:hypothetical protein
MAFWNGLAQGRDNWILKPSRIRPDLSFFTVNNKASHDSLFLSRQGATMATVPSGPNPERNSPTPISNPSDNNRRAAPDLSWLTTDRQ